MADFRANLLRAFVQLRRPKLRVASDRVARGMLAGWAVAMTAVGVTLLARHAVALPPPAADAQAPIAALRSPVDSGRWMMVHVLYTECRCSQRIVSHLTESVRPEGVREHVLLVGNDARMEKALSEKSFAITHVTASELSARYHVGAAPLFLVVAPDGSIRYSGGYTSAKQGPEPKDLELFSEIQSRGIATALPIFGCAVSAELRALINPLRLP